MTFDWKAVENLVRTVAPTVATALGGPLAGIATQAISAAVLGKPDGTQDELSAALAMATPDMLLKIKQSEQDFKTRMKELGIKEDELVFKDLADARGLAEKESDGAPAWTKILTATHRPIWSLVMLALFGWTILAPYVGWQQIPLSDAHKSIMEMVIMFYFGGRSIEKISGAVWGK